MLTLIVLTSLKILFVYGAMQEGMILFPLRQLLERLLNLLPLRVERVLSKPLYACLFCMSSVWGLLFTAPYMVFEWSPLFVWQYLTTLFAIGGVNYLLATIIGFIHRLQKEEE